MAPEIFLCKNSNSHPFNPFKADIFSFGVLLIELNSPSFNPRSTRNSELKLREKYLEEQLNELKEKANPFYSIITSCLEINVEKRPSIGELKLQLSQLLKEPFNNP